MLLVDADPQASALSWNETAVGDGGVGFPFPVMALPTRELHRQLPDVIGNRFDAIVIDTPPLEQRAGIVASALRVTTLAVVPLAPTPIEYQRLTEVRELADDTASFRADNRPVPLAILLTRVVPRAVSTTVYREQAQFDGFLCLQAVVGRLERFAQAFGDPVKDASRTAYGEAITELLEREYVA